MKHIGVQDTVRLEQVERDPGLVEVMRRGLAHQLAEVMLKEGLIRFSPSTGQDQFGALFTICAEAVAGQPKA